MNDIALPGPAKDGWLLPLIQLIYQYSVDLMIANKPNMTNRTANHW